MKDLRAKPAVSSIEALAIVIGMIIGSGIFLKPGVVLGHAGSFFLGTLAWIVGGIIALAAALSIAEIAAAIPKPGGFYTYFEELYGELPGFLLGWVETVIVYPATIAALAIAFGTYSSFLIPGGMANERVIAISLLAFLLVINMISTKCGGVIQIVATIGKLIPIFIIIGFAFCTDQGMVSHAVKGDPSGAGFGAAVLGTLWAYDGWMNVTNLSGELKDPAKTLPRVIFLGVVFVMMTYVLFNVAIYILLPYEQIILSPAPGTDAAKVLFGPQGGAFLTVGIILSVFGALNGQLMTAARIPQAMAMRNQLPFSRLLSGNHPGFQTPANALILESLLAILYLFSGSFHRLTDLLIFVIWIFFTMGVFGVFLLRKREGWGRADNKKQRGRGQYRVPFYPLTPIIGAGGGLYILAATMISSPVRCLLGVAIALLGIPVYLALGRNKS